MEEIVPAAEGMAIDAAIVSETDAAHSHASSDEENYVFEENDNRPSATSATRISRAFGTDATSGNSNELRAANPHDCGESSNNDQLSGVDSDSDVEIDMNDDSRASQSEDMYCANMDDEDEAWVYKHMRGGQEELVYVRQQQHSRKQKEAINKDLQQQGRDASSDANEQNDASNPKSDSKLPSEPIRSANDPNKMQADGDVSESVQNNAKIKAGEVNDGEPCENADLTQSNNNPILQKNLLKPRTSDAILSCPRCFTTVCMDCQQHETYANQFRAMFVMNIGVDWQKRMVYDVALGGLKASSGGNGANDNVMRLQMDNREGGRRDTIAAEFPNTIPHEDSKSNEELYYSVHCSYCQWEVAALDMTDEIYYFFGCIASS